MLLTQSVVWSSAPYSKVDSHSAQEKVSEQWVSDCRD